MLRTKENILLISYVVKYKIVAVKITKKKKNDVGARLKSRNNIIFSKKKKKLIVIKSNTYSLRDLILNQIKFF